MPTGRTKAYEKKLDLEYTAAELKAVLARDRELEHLLPELAVLIDCHVQYFLEGYLRKGWLRERIRSYENETGNKLTKPKKETGKTNGQGRTSKSKKVHQDKPPKGTTPTETC